MIEIELLKKLLVRAFQGDDGAVLFLFVRPQDAGPEETLHGQVERIQAGGGNPKILLLD